MNKILTICLLIGCYANSFAQSDNALDFDNIDDNVVVQQASSLIAGSSEASISIWVYPENQAPSFPDFDGIVGFRNELDADFYLLHLSSTSVEVRLRNSGGQIFTMNWSGIQLNTWQHFVYMYDGTNLTLYHNGDSVSSIPATGNIINPNVDLGIGNLTFQTSNFYHNGKIDEVSMWNKALTSSEVRCIYKNDVDTSMTGLQAYYRFNQGVAGGNNTGINLLNDETGTVNGVLNFFGLNGSSSNFVNGTINYDSTFFSVCQGASVIFSGDTLRNSGRYPFIFTDVEGCDSTVMVTLDVLPVDTAVTKSGITLTASSTPQSFQWVDCDNNFAIIPGETSMNFTPTSNGNYAVIVDQAFCTDTSNCHMVTSVGFADHSDDHVLQLYPNPTTDRLCISIDELITRIEVFSNSGKRVLLFEDGLKYISVEELPEGNYSILVHLVKSIHRKSFQVIKQ